jgi:hypothetical protein
MSDSTTTCQCLWLQNTMCPLHVRVPGKQRRSWLGQAQQNNLLANYKCKGQSAWLWFSSLRNYEFRFKFGIGHLQWKLRDTGTWSAAAWPSHRLCFRPAVFFPQLPLIACPGIESRWGARFSAPVQTGPGAYPASYIMGTGSFPGVMRPGRRVDHPPPSSAEVKERVELYIYSPSGPSWSVPRWTLPLPLPLIALSFPQGKIRRTFKKFYHLSFLIV